MMDTGAENPPASPADAAYAALVAVLAANDNSGWQNFKQHPLLGRIPTPTDTGPPWPNLNAFLEWSQTTPPVVALVDVVDMLEQTAAAPTLHISDLRAVVAAWIGLLLTRWIDANPEQFAPQAQLAQTAMSAPWAAYTIAIHRLQETFQFTPTHTPTPAMLIHAPAPVEGWSDADAKASLKSALMFAKQTRRLNASPGLNSSTGWPAIPRHQPGAAAEPDDVIQAELKRFVAQWQMPLVFGVYAEELPHHPLGRVEMREYLHRTFGAGTVAYAQSGAATPAAVREFEMALVRKIIQVAAIFARPATLEENRMENKTPNPTTGGFHVHGDAHFHGSAVATGEHSTATVTNSGAAAPANLAEALQQLLKLAAADPNLQGMTNPLKEMQELVNKGDKSSGVLERLKSIWGYAGPTLAGAAACSTLALRIPELIVKYFP